MQLRVCSMGTSMLADWYPHSPGIPDDRMLEDMHDVLFRHQAHRYFLQLL